MLENQAKENKEWFKRLKDKEWKNLHVL